MFTPFFVGANPAGKKLHGRRAHQRRGAPPSWRVGIGRSARGSRAARPLASLRSIAPGSAPRAARSARLRLRIVLLRTESSRSARLRLLAGGYRDLGFQASAVDSSSPHYCPRRNSGAGIGAISAMEEGLRCEALPGDGHAADGAEGSDGHAVDGTAGGDGHATDGAEGGVPATSLGDREQAILSSSILR